MLAIPLMWLAIFAYWPMYGAIIAFKDYNIVDGILGSRWVGMKHFERFVESYQFWRLIKNTLILHVYELVATFWLPILLALGLNMARRRWYRRSVQLITYAPHFISTVVVVGLIVVIVDPNSGVLNLFLGQFGIGPIDVLSNPDYFRHLYVWSGAWQTMGFSAIIYLAALTSVSPELHEAAIVDGASRLRRVWHIDLPAIRPVAVILLILNIGSIMSVGFEKVLLLQNTAEPADVGGHRHLRLQARLRLTGPAVQLRRRDRAVPVGDRPGPAGAGEHAGAQVRQVQPLVSRPTRCRPSAGGVPPPVRPTARGRKRRSSRPGP